MSQLQNYPELWGGVESTVNRVGDTFFDQLQRSGHRKRAEEDLARFAKLGIKALRTAIHWESFDQTGSWDFGDTVLAEMQRLGIRPIVGLLHHGSGPHATDLLDPGFPEKLAAFALKVAERYPDLLDYTPVNEPQTTGRFACLYGHWYPHHRSMRSYLRALHNEVKGVALAMQSIFFIHTESRVIYTEDGGMIFSTPPLERFRVQREHRRWLGCDLLCGLVTHDHPLFDFLLEEGLAEAEVLWFAENACPPSVLGLNYYVTSDRLLDHRLDLYPGWAGGDTGSEPLVDIEAVRVLAKGIAGPGAILRQAWERYRLPVAITEAHLGCDPLEQMRWLTEVWREANQARAAGADVRAVTIWALLGSYNWSNLCTQDTGVYEPGVFDLSSGEPVATPLAELAYQLAHGLPLDREITAAGWWHSAERLTIPPCDGDLEATAALVSA